MTEARILQDSLTVAELEELRSCEAIIDAGLKVYFEVGSALQLIRENRLYRATHATYEEYCQARWGISRSRAYQLTGAAETVKNLSTIVDIPPASESLVRPLNPFAPQQQRDIFQEAQATAPNGKLTGAHVASVAKKHHYIGQQVYYIPLTYLCDIKAVHADQTVDLKARAGQWQKPNVPFADIETPDERKTRLNAPSAAVAPETAVPDDDLPIRQSHPLFSAQETAHATCAGCGETDARWKAVQGGYWVHACGVKTADSEMQPYTVEDRDAEARMDQRRSGRQKPKANRAADEDDVSPTFDRCQTPGKALDPLLPYLPPNLTLWEPAAGDGLLVDALYDAEFPTVISSDILTGQDFFTIDPPTYDIQVTNPPYSKKYAWLARCFELGKPFALLLPVETLGAKTAQILFKEYGIEVILLDQRINFKMPEKGWGGNGAQFPVAWFTWGLNIGAQLTFAHVKRDDEGDE